MDEPDVSAAPAPRLPAWLRLASRLPLPLLHAIAAMLVFLAFRVLRLRVAVARANITACFPEASAATVRRILRDNYYGYGQMFAELVRSAAWPAGKLAARVVLANPQLPRQWLAQGRPVLLVGAHLANWEWAIQGITVQLGYPVDAAYKPIKRRWAEQAMLALRQRFGARMVPAKQLLPDLLARRQVVRGIALLADQAPTSSDHRAWVDFLGRDTAFYVGAGQMARALRYPALFVSMRRVARSRYEVAFSELAAPGESLAPEAFTRRYATLLQAQIRAAPAGWTWGHRRWKLSRS